MSKPATCALLLALMVSGCDPADSKPPEDTGPAVVDADGDGHLDGDDCDDQDPTVHPDAEERCDGVDNDCDGEVDEDASDAPSWYADADGDGYGDVAVAVHVCSTPAGHVSDATDCDDGDAAVHPDATERCNGIDDDCDGDVDDDDADLADAVTWYQDDDGDGYGQDHSTTSACERPSGYAAEGGDCDDGDVSYHPGATEEDCADPADYNCDGSVGYADEDGDGWAACEDCDDGDGAVNPAATERCDGIDNDCDGSTDEDDAADAPTWYADADADGYGDAGSGTAACSQPTGHVADATDCDDGDGAVNPAATERCDGIDNDCDGSTDEDDAADAPTWYADADADGYGDAGSGTAACSQPTGHVADATDCDDGDGAVNPAATERCDGIDNDCDGSTDEDDAADAPTWYADADADGWADETRSLHACEQPSGFLSVDDLGDCNDAEASIHPGSGCDWVVSSYVPGTSYLYLGSEEGGSFTVDDGHSVQTLTVAAGEVDDSLTLAAGAYTLRGSAPFLAHFVDVTTSGDKLASLRGPAGDPVDETLFGWAGEWLVLLNPQASAVTVTVDSWAGGWSSVGTATIDPGDAVSFSTSWGYHRVQADGAISGYGADVANIENHMEYAAAEDGDYAGDRFLWFIPEVIGRVGLSGICLDAAGCGVEIYEEGSLTDSHSLVQGGTFTDYVTANTLYEVLSDADILLRDESTPSGFTATDGTIMDTDLVPGTSGWHYDVEFLVHSCEGNAGSPYDTRRSDLYLIGYRDGTTVDVEQLSGGSWTLLGTVVLNAGEVSLWDSDLDPRTTLRVSADLPIHVQLSHTSWELAWGAYSEHYADAP